MDAKTNALMFDQKQDIYIVARYLPQNNLLDTKEHHLYQVIKLNITIIKTNPITWVCPNGFRRTHHHLYAIPTKNT